MEIRSPRPQGQGHWGERLADAGDLNADGVNDLLVGVPFEGPGAVYGLSGRALSRGRVEQLFRIAPPEAESRFGFAISSIGDVDGDRTPDLAAGQGKAWLFSGKSGKLIRALSDPQPQVGGRFGSRIGRAGDVTGDGVSEIVVGAPGKDVPAGCSRGPAGAVGCRAGEGEAFIFDGATGRLVRKLGMPAGDKPPGVCTASCGSFGLSVQGPGDANGDGSPDQLVSAPSYNQERGRAYLFSGKTGDLLRSIDSPEPQSGASFGFQDVAPLSPGDINKDGHPDIYLNGFLQNGPAGPGQGRAWVFSGKDGALLQTLDDPSPIAGGQFGWSMAKIDANGDKVPDLYIGSAPHHLHQPNQDGGTYLFDGKNAEPIKTLDLPQSLSQGGGRGNLGPNLGWSVAAPGDLNNDGRPDYAAGAPFADGAAGSDEGALLVFLSQGNADPGGGQRAGGQTTGRERSRLAQNLVYALVAVFVLAGAFFFVRHVRRRGG